MIILQGVYQTVARAKDELREFARKHGSCVKRVDYNEQYVQIGDLKFYFLGYVQEETWCKGRTYVYNNELWHGDRKVKA